MNAQLVSQIGEFNKTLRDVQILEKSIMEACFFIDKKVNNKFIDDMYTREQFLVNDFLNDIISGSPIDRTSLIKHYQDNVKLRMELKVYILATNVIERFSDDLFQLKKSREYIFETLLTV